MVVNEFEKQSDYPQRVYRKNTATGGKRNLIDRRPKNMKRTIATTRHSNIVLNPEFGIIFGDAYQQDKGISTPLITVS